MPSPVTKRHPFKDRWSKLRCGVFIIRGAEPSGKEIGLGNLLTAMVEIVGTRAMLWHHFGPNAIPLEKGERTGVAGNDPEEWRETVLMTADRQLYLDPSYVFATIRDGAKYTKKGRGSIQSDVTATLQVLDEQILVDRFLPEEPIPRDASQPVYLDVRMVKNPTTKARNVRYRVAASKGWHVTFSLLWDRTIVNRMQMEAATRDAGKLCGLANGRAIGFGRFDVLDFKVTEE